MNRHSRFPLSRLEGSGRPSVRAPLAFAPFLALNPSSVTSPCSRSSRRVQMADIEDVVAQVDVVARVIAPDVTSSSQIARVGIAARRTTFGASVVPMLPTHRS